MSETRISMEHESTENAIEKKRLWEEQRDFRCLIDDKNGIERYFELLDADTKRELFHRTDLRVGCIDEGCSGYEKGKGEPCGYRIAGSGILIAPKDRAAFMAKCLRLGVNGFTYHDNCGAAGVYAKEHGGNPAKVAKEFSEKMAKELGVGVSHITAKEMSRPEEFHVTRFAYYDGTGRLNLKNAAGKLPNGFVQTRALYPSQESAVAEAKLVYDIASGSHGFGELITADEPFEIIVIGDADDPELSLIKLEKELAPLAANPKTKITGFEVSPRQLDQ